jgi:hypothetical protein
MCIGISLSVTLNKHFKTNIIQHSVIDDEDVVGGDSRRIFSESPVVPRLYPVLESRSADELTPGKELRAVGNERGCSPLV